LIVPAPDPAAVLASLDIGDGWFVEIDPVDIC